MWLEWIDLVHLWQDLGTKLCHRDYRSCCELKTLCQSLHARTQVFEDYYHLKFHGSFKGMFHLQTTNLSSIRGRYRDEQNLHVHPQIEALVPEQKLHGGRAPRIEE
jgi:hypothetical protein